MADIAQQTDVQVTLGMSEDGQPTVSEEDKERVRRMYVRGNTNIKFKTGDGDTVAIFFPLSIQEDSEGSLEVLIGAPDTEAGVVLPFLIGFGNITPDDYKD